VALDGGGEFFELWKIVSHPLGHDAEVVGAKAETVGRRPAREHPTPFAVATAVHQNLNIVMKMIAARERMTAAVSITGAPRQS
jgi:hypothetical protein